VAQLVSAGATIARDCGARMAAGMATPVASLHTGAWKRYETGWQTSPNRLSCPRDGSDNGDLPTCFRLIALTLELEMKFAYLTAAALAVGLFAAQPVMAQSMSHEPGPKPAPTQPHKKKTKHTKKHSAASTAPTAPATTTDAPKTQ
jgi:hypothetical protein